MVLCSKSNDRANIRTCHLTPMKRVVDPNGSMSSRPTTLEPENRARTCNGSIEFLGMRGVWPEPWLQP
jgi:hypothetical protein